MSLLTGCSDFGLGNATVRERLGHEPQQLDVVSTISTGWVTARRWTPDGWVEGTTQLDLEPGTMEASSDAQTLTLDTLVVHVAPIAIPDEVFRKPASLHDVTLTLMAPAPAEAQWRDDNDATATFTLVLALDWALVIDGRKAPLATQKLPPVPAHFWITGDGDHLHAALDLLARGELWNWADLLQLTVLDLSLLGATDH